MASNFFVLDRNKFFIINFLISLKLLNLLKLILKIILNFLFHGQILQSYYIRLHNQEKVFFVS